MKGPMKTLPNRSAPRVPPLRRTVLPLLASGFVLSVAACSSTDGTGESGGDGDASLTGGAAGDGDGDASGGVTGSGTGGGENGDGDAAGSGGALPAEATFCERWHALGPGELPGFATDSVCNDFAEVQTGDVGCSGTESATAEIARVELAQNHVLVPTTDDYTTNESGENLAESSVRPKFRLISHRPARLFVGVTGSGAAPQVGVTARRNDETLGTLCLPGPATLPADISADPSGSDRFAVNLPAEWIRSGLSLEISAGGATRTVTAEELRVGAGTRHIVMEGSMVLYGLPPQTVPMDDPDDYLMSDELPVQSAVWAHFPVPVVMDPMTMSAKSGNPARIVTVKEGSFDEVGEMLDVFAEIRRANGHIEDTGYYAALPDGWGGGLGGGNGSSGPPSQLMIRHEGGHAYGLPHLEDAYDQGRYPFAKRTNGTGCVLGVPGEDGCGVGPHFKFFQTPGTFESPWDDEGGGVYKRDPMAGGGNNWFGAYTDQWLLDYFRNRPFFDLESGTYMKYDEASGEFVPDTEVVHDNWYRRPVERDVPVYTIFGSYSADVSEVNVIQPPLHYRGHLQRTMDPTNAEHLDWMKENSASDACQNDCDFVVRVTFDGTTVTNVLVPRGAGGYTRWAINVPDQGAVTRVELYRRDLDNGNVDAATVANYFDSATLVAERNF